MVEQALSDVKVLDVTHYIAGPYCTKLLADYGAHVIKVEQPGGGDPARNMGPFPGDNPHPEKSGLYLYLNTNKKGITLNLKTETGKEIFKELVKDIDILVENFEPRVMPGLGLGWETLSRINPKLVMMSISNFGQTGPYRDYKASEINLFGMGSEMYATGLPDRKPVMIEPYANLFLAGAAAATGTIAGFYASRYQDVGQHIDMAIIEARSTGTTRRGVNLIVYQYTGDVNPRLPSFDVGYPHGVHPCGKGYIDIFGGRWYWDRVVKMLGDPDWLKDPKWLESTAQANPELKEEFEAHFMAWLMERTMEEAAQEAQKAGVPCVPVQMMEDVVNDPHFNERDAFIEIDHPVAGKFKYIGRPFIMSETPWQFRKPAPMLGQHNAEVYGKLGYSGEELIRLRQQGVI